MQLQFSIFQVRQSWSLIFLQPSNHTNTTTNIIFVLTDYVFLIIQRTWCLFPHVSFNLLCLDFQWENLRKIERGRKQDNWECVHAYYYLQPLIDGKDLQIRSKKVGVSHLKELEDLNHIEVGLINGPNVYILHASSHILWYRVYKQFSTIVSYASYFFNWYNIIFGFLFAHLFLHFMYHMGLNLEKLIACFTFLL